MTTPSAFSNAGLSIALLSPLVGTRTYPALWITDKITSYNHTNSAFGGFDSAEIVMAGNQVDVEGIFSTGLARHVQVHNPALSLCWEGFVNEIELVIGGLTVTRGPVMDIANRVSVVYADDGSGSGVVPPVTGARMTTVVANDTASQGIYGIIEKVLSSGPRIPAEAVRERDTYLTEHSYPPTSQQLTLGRTGNQVQVTLRCLGYFHWLDTYVYNYVVDDNQIGVSTKLLRILAADTNAIFSTDYSGVTANAFLVSGYEDDDMMAMALVKSLVALGGVAYERYLFNVYDNRKIIYAAAPTDWEYQWRIADRSQNVYSRSGARVDPWDIKPGKWLFLSDFLSGRTQSANLRLDPRMVFIESVSFDAPYGLTITGGKTDRLPQLLAELSLGGIDA
jgi:hypothetical protein